MMTRRQIIAAAGATLAGNTEAHPLLGPIAGRARRSATFDPLTLTPALWLDASDATTLYDATSGGSLVGSGGAVARWEDKSGNAMHFVQATSGNRPARTVASINGLDVVTFDGSNDSLSAGSGLGLFRNLAGGAWVVVCKWLTLPTAEKSFLLAFTNSGVNRLGLIITGGNNRAGAGGRRLDANSFNLVVFGSNETSTQRFYAAVADWANSDLRLYRDSSYVDNTSFQTDGLTSDTDSSAIQIGGWSGQGFVHAAFCEVFAFKYALSPTQIGQLQAYAISKWGTAP